MTLASRVACHSFCSAARALSAAFLCAARSCTLLSAPRLTYSVRVLVCATDRVLDAGFDLSVQALGLHAHPF